MATIVLFDDLPAQADALGLALSGAGHSVEAFSRLDAARARLSASPAQLMVIAVRSTDGGPGLLVSQCRAAWPDCRVVAIVASDAPARSKISEMGLWEPDLVLTGPVAAQTLIDAVTRLESRPDPPAPSANLSPQKN